MDHFVSWICECLLSCNVWKREERRRVLTVSGGESNRWTQMQKEGAKQTFASINDENRLDKERVLKEKERTCLHNFGTPRCWPLKDIKVTSKLSPSQFIKSQVSTCLQFLDSLLAFLLVIQVRLRVWLLGPLRTWTLTSLVRT